MNRLDYHSQIHDYLDGELSAGERQAFEAQLARDPSLQSALAAFEQIERDAATLPSLIEPSKDLWTDIAPRLEQPATPSSRSPHQDRAPQPRAVHRHLLFRRYALIAVVFMAVSMVLFWLLSAPRWNVEALSGAPRIANTLIHAKGYMGRGEWLETDAASRAKVDVSTIGQVVVEPNSRLQLLTSKLTEHRIALDRGRIEASIWAPPRLFFVDTPAATAIDLGCAYTLEVDSTGTTYLHVTSGWVALVRGNREALVPAGASGRTYPGIGPGTPYFEDASASFKTNLATIDTGGLTDDVLTNLLQEARLDDTLTLWHLLAHVETAARGQIFDTMTALQAPPQGITRAGILALDTQQMDRWRTALRPYWTRSTSPFWLDALKQVVPN